MKNSALWLAILLASVCSLSAQVTVEVLTKQSAFLPSEAVMVWTRVVNNSGQTLRLGKDDWLTFSVEAKDGFVVYKNGEVPVAREFDLPSAKMATKRVDLAPYFTLSRPGRYTMTASVKIPEWGLTVNSDPVTFEIVSGVTIGDPLQFGVPQANPNQEPEVRKYSLQKAVFLNNTKLYLRLTDASESQVYKVFAIGTMPNFARPEARLDQGSNLHVMFQSGARLFTYEEITPAGDVILHQTYDDTTSKKPRLFTADSGQVIPVGGLRHLSDDDIPPTRELSSDDVKAPAP